MPWPTPAAAPSHLVIPRFGLVQITPTNSVLVDTGIDVVERILREIPPNPHAIVYLRIKQERMGHTLTLVQADGLEQRKWGAKDIYRTSRGWLFVGTVGLTTTTSEG